MRPVRAVRRRWPAARGSVRVRMTLLYSAAFTVIAGGVLIVAQRIQKSILDSEVNNAFRPVSGTPCETRPPGAPCAGVPYDSSKALPFTPETPGAQVRHPAAELQDTLEGTQRTSTLIAILVIVVLAFVVCWWLTGRLLRPLHRITGTARRLSLSTLHERIALTGPQDEFKDLADTFDAMLDRLELAVASQRRFVANASHELRTPLAVQRTAIEVGLADPSPAKIARIRTELMRNTQRSERLIEGLLVLAQGERGLDVPAPVELNVLVEQAIAEHRPLAERAGITIGGTTGPITVTGDEVLLTRLVANLVQNAIKYNRPGGHILVDLSPGTGLVVRNTGHRIRPDQVDELFEPFRRLQPDRTGSADGAGLGLSIVSAITHAHGGTVHATANPDGGLTITVALPAPTAFPEQPLGDPEMKH
ncbi:ATP-binding protein [Actinomadura vinacea]|uniref:histidine kinase n=1 Tax=Actinomadura vinacea TaxID=115336 RepID=A0ABN3JUN5_9ACTN